MGTTTPLLERLIEAEARRDEADRRFLERVARPAPTRSRWIREGRAVRDLTDYVRGAFVPTGVEPGA